MSILAYKVNADEVLKRLRALSERRAQDRIFAAFEIPGKALAAFQEQNTECFCDYPEPSARINFWDALLKERLEIEDDSIPSAHLSEFDQGLYGGLLGGEVKFMKHQNGMISSMVMPLLKEWSEFASLEFDEFHPWFQRYLRQLKIFAEGGKGKFGISHFILINGLNFVFELVGATKTYMSLFESPEMIHKAIELGFNLNLKVQNTFFDNVPSLMGGTCSTMAQWLPGRIVSESVDPFHMTSVDYFEKWGRGPVERIFSRFDGGVLHLHGNGRHLLEAVCSLHGVKAIGMGDDKGFPPAFDILNELKMRAGNIPLIVKVDYNNFVESMAQHRLPGGIFYLVEGAAQIDTVNRCMEKVRSYQV